MEAMKRAVVRDLGDLLNTRETGEPATSEHKELERSIYNYGIEDFAQMFAEDASTDVRLRRQIERKIELFEPRLADVRVKSVEEDENTLGARRFHVSGRLRLDPDPRRPEFDTFVEMKAGGFEVQG